MGMAQGHWFKCQNGHIYCITECGGAMEESKCPECGSRIGGHNHQLVADNRVAGEMDGARYAAITPIWLTWQTLTLMTLCRVKFRNLGTSYKQARRLL
ncbi:NFX1-type zinc finger-containing protein 1 [Desmophyllum pertusum]|uniref:NFX1-type zinc finger-containing protein 1 n=1 Tax=Desmophyllum pertusum TaxID=174260 RepID=A0A9W9YC60_9CNID|nr:NFX1-type zinc finger-containing protein 1 [Desmophyllum pertusum]